MLRRAIHQFALNTPHKHVFRNIYKSQYNVEVLYPGSRKIGTQDVNQDNREIFTGEIPVEKLDIKYVRSSGPGGQHVNTTNSKAQVRFNLQSASWLPNETKLKMIEQNKRRITKDGDLLIQCGTSRYQLTNLGKCLELIKEMINEAQRPPDPEIQKRKDALLNEESVEKAKEIRLRKKKVQSYTKSMRNSF